MADIRTLKKSYLREAAAAGRSTYAAKSAWLEQKRREAQAEVDAGDWEVTQTSGHGASSTQARRLTAADRLKALIAAIEQLEAENGDNDTGSTGQLLSFRVVGIQP